MSRLARLLALAAVLAAVVVLAGPASAATVTEDRALTAAELQAGAYTLACPSGERIVSASASFYRTAKHKNPLGADLAPTTTTSDANGNLVAATWTLPKGAKYVQATVVCEPIPTTTVVTASGVQVADEVQRVNCPPEYPYVTSTFTFTGDADGDLSTTGDQFPLQSRFLLRLVGNDPGVPNYTGFEFRLDPGMAWTAEVTCTSIEPMTTTVEQSGVFSGQSVAVWCPGGMSFVDATVYGDRDADLTTTADRYLIAYDVLDGNRIAFVGPLGHGWLASLTCRTA
jgi:hypothetical protein